MKLPSTGFGSLSPRRQRVLAQLLPEVVPSVYGSAAFRQIDANWKPGAGYTTCGGLIGHVVGRLGLTQQMRLDGMGSGLTSVRNAAIRHGAWVHCSDACGQGPGVRNSAGGRPLPGDIYILCSGGGHDFGCCCIQTDKTPGRLRGAAVEHIGIIVDTGCDCLWITADAGQGGGQAQYADYVLRQYNADTGYMTGEQSREGKPMRRLCGWVDIDRFPFLDGC